LNASNRINEDVTSRNVDEAGNLTSLSRPANHRQVATMSRIVFRRKCRKVSVTPFGNLPGAEIAQPTLKDGGLLSLQLGRNV
jgi:hypothetical protein